MTHYSPLSFPDFSSMFDVLSGDGAVPLFPNVYYVYPKRYFEHYSPVKGLKLEDLYLNNFRMNLVKDPQ